MKKLFLLFAVALFFSCQNGTVSANEIRYGQIQDVSNNEISVRYNGPLGQEHFVCDILTSECEFFGTSTPSLFPDIEGQSTYSKSSSGEYGVLKAETKIDDDTTLFIHTVYDISGNEAEIAGVVPYFKDTHSYRFPWGGEHVMLFGVDGTVVTYGIKNSEMSMIKPNQSELPMRSLSPYGKYLSAYNYLEEEHRIWNTKTGEVVAIPSETPDFVEFSQNERFAVFVDESEGYKTLRLVDLENNDHENNSQWVFDENLTVEDFIFFKNNLYIKANTEDDPYDWVLYQFNTENKRLKKIADNVSYASYMRPAGDHGLLFLQIKGKNTNVAVYIPESDIVRVFEAVEPSPASLNINRKVIAFDRAKGVIYEPKRSNNKPDLFIWLHGGPRRQASFGYHSYLSYAVYDELLEKLTESGSYVLKLDYAGSIGHGNSLTDALMNNLGVADVTDVIDATRKMRSLYDINNVYLIGNSYGGYLGPKTLVDHPDMFNGAVAINGVFDWYTLLQRIPSSPFSIYFNGLVNLEDLDENFELYRKASIYKNLPDLDDKKKIILIYGKEDSTVPVWQTTEFFYLAKAHEKNVKLLSFSDEGHIITKRENLSSMCKFIADELVIDDLKCLD